MSDEHETPNEDDGPEVGPGGKDPAPGETGDHDDVGERGLASKTGGLGGGVPTEPSETGSEHSPVEDNRD